MKFKITSKLILDEEEFNALDTAYSLVADMDEETEVRSCECCPKYEKCDGMEITCAFTVARKALKEIINMVTVEKELKI